MNRFTGVVLVTGEHGTGKTSFGLESGDPARMLFVDNDLKGRSTVEQIKADGIKFGRYIDLIKLGEKKKALDFHMAVLETIDSIKENEFDVLVWDTWTEFAATTYDYVAAYPDRFRDNDQWAAMGKIRKGEEYKEARFYEAELIANVQRKAPLVILVSHLKNLYVNNAPTGKEVPAVSKAVDRVCNLRLWFRHNPTGGVPVALVLKNFDRKVYDAEQKRLRTVRILPTRMTPMPGDQSVWDIINRYYDSPIGLREPLPHEIPDDFENSIVEGTLTEDQRLSWLYAIKQERQREEEELLVSLAENKEKAADMKEEGKSLSEIAQELGVTIKQVLDMLKEQE